MTESDDPSEPRERVDERRDEPRVRERRPGFTRRHWGKLTLAMLLLLPVAVFAIWTAITLGFSYSQGTRTGYAQKLSQKGWVCKTWEGELAISAVPGVA